MHWEIKKAVWLTLLRYSLSCCGPNPQYLQDMPAKWGTCMVFRLGQEALLSVTTLTVVSLAQSSTSIYIISVFSSQRFHCVISVLFKYLLVISGHAKCLSFAKNLQGYCISQLRLPQQDFQAGWFKKQKFILSHSGDWKSKIKVPEIPWLPNG